MLIKMFSAIIPGLFVFMADASSQEVLGSAGGCISARIQMDFTIGESITDTYQGKDKSITQGFHQPSMAVRRIQPPGLQRFDMKVYPNPTTDFLIVEKYGEENQDGLNIHLYDERGRLLQARILNPGKNTLDMRDMAAATYLLTVAVDGANYVFKIIKNN